MSQKLYFNSHDEEIARTIEGNRMYMRENDLLEMDIYEARVQKVDGNFWCKEYESIGEAGECGKQCSAYKPRNGKSGRCVYHGQFYEPTDKKTTLKV